MEGYCLRAGDVYSGAWFEGCPHGHGRCVYSTGDCYEGEWEAGQWQGRGCFVRRTGQKVEGLFDNNVFQSGLPDGISPEGDEGAAEALCGRPLHGYGRFTFANGGSFDGIWRDGKPWQGDLVRGDMFGDALEYSGTIEVGLREGHGEVRCSNGDIYEGGWCDDQRHGMGILRQLTRGRGSEEGYFEGHWRKGFPWQGTMQDFQCINGDFFTGELEDGQREGPGRLFLRNGNIFTGEFHCGERAHGHVSTGLTIVATPQFTNLKTL